MRAWPLGFLRGLVPIATCAAFIALCCFLGLGSGDRRYIDNSGTGEGVVRSTINEVGLNTYAGLNRRLLQLLLAPRPPTTTAIFVQRARALGLTCDQGATNAICRTSYVVVVCNDSVILFLIPTRSVTTEEIAKVSATFDQNNSSISVTIGERVLAIRNRNNTCVPFNRDYGRIVKETIDRNKEKIP